MKTCSCCGQRKPAAAFEGRYGGETRQCETCRASGRRRAARHVAQNPDVVANRQARYKSTPGYRKKKRAQERRYSAKNVEKENARKREWRQANPAKMTHYTNVRRARKLRATPKWADQKAIAEIYMKAALEAVLTGKKIQVDHIVPLKNARVCGLHCEANLAIVEKAYNVRKSNTTWPDMPETEL